MDIDIKKAGNHLLYGIIAEHYLVLECFYGDITIEELIECKKIEFSDPDYNKQYSALVHVTDSIPKFSIDKLESFIELLEKLDFPVTRKLAIVADKPAQAAYAMMFSSMRNKKTPSHPIKIFSTGEPALRWLGKSAKERAELSELYDSFISYSLAV